MKAFVERYWWLGASLIVLIIWLYFLLAFNPLPSKTVSYQEYWAWRGTYGDVFGIVNSLFSAFVVIGIAYGVVQQNDEIKTLKADANEQRFLTHLFYLLDKLELNIEKITFKGHLGREAVSAIVEQFDDREARACAGLYLLGVWNILSLIGTQPVEKRILYIDIFTSRLSLLELRLLFKQVEIRPDSQVSKLFNNCYQSKERNIL